MRKQFNKVATLLATMSASGANLQTAMEAGVEMPKQSKPRFVAGDHFYNHLSFKRVNGKWRVKR
jgi:hypothetical protein